MRTLLALLLVFGMGGFAGCSRQVVHSDEAKRPNVGFILTDDQRWDTPMATRDAFVAQRNPVTPIGL